MIKKITIKTTYGSTIKMDTCFHINVTFERVKITYLHNNKVAELKLPLKDITFINIIPQENEQ